MEIKLIDKTKLTKKYFYYSDVEYAVRAMIEKIRLAPNRDDKVHAQLMITDMGGIGKHDVYQIIEEFFGDFKP